MMHVKYRSRVTKYADFTAKTSIFLVYILIRTDGAGARSLSLYWIREKKNVKHFICATFKPPRWYSSWTMADRGGGGCIARFEELTL